MSVLQPFHMRKADRLFGSTKSSLYAFVNPDRYFLERFDDQYLKVEDVNNKLRPNLCLESNATDEYRVQKSSKQLAPDCALGRTLQAEVGSAWRLWGRADRLREIVEENDGVCGIYQQKLGMDEEKENIRPSIRKRRQPQQPDEDTVHSSPECIVNEPRGHRKYDHLGQAGLQGSRNAGIDSSQGGTDLRPEFSDYKPGNQSQRVSLEVFSDPIRETRRQSSQGGTDLRPEFRDYKPGNQSQRVSLEVFSDPIRETRRQSSQGGTDLRPEFRDYKPGNQSQRVSLEVFSDPIRETRRSVSPLQGLVFSSVWLSKWGPSTSFLRPGNP
ncbi:hypothetical protein Bbelb_311770 [Branchiostoma belcheri]|nr:hypothetical protein Bbelb_311770 [Branchiostoma belcheri]